MSLPHQFQPGVSGNPKGAPTSMERLRRICGEMQFDPVKEAILRYRDPMTPPSSKDFCLGLVMDRVVPKLKAVEIRTEGTNSLQQVLINVIAGTKPNEIETPSQQQWLAPDQARQDLLPSQGYGTTLAETAPQPGAFDDTREHSENIHERVTSVK